MLQLQLQNWCAYHPDSSHSIARTSSRLLEDSLAFDVTFLPVLRRRRLSRLSRLCLRLAHQLNPCFQGYCVFGSQHGELVTTQALLEQISHGELPSPAGFSASVHNTAAGLHSINTGNERPYTSVAAGQDTLPMCFLEAWSILTSRPAEQVLLVYADDAVPALYRPFTEAGTATYGFAALLSLAHGGKQIRLAADYKDSSERSTEGMQQLFELFDREGAATMLRWRGEAHDWMWDVDG